MWKLFCFTAPWVLNWMLIFRTHNLFINHKNILFKTCKAKTYCFLRLNVHSRISLEYLPWWNCRYHLLKEVVYIIVAWQPLSLFSQFSQNLFVFLCRVNIFVGCLSKIPGNFQRKSRPYLRNPFSTRSKTWPILTIKVMFCL